VVCGLRGFGGGKRCNAVNLTDGLDGLAAGTVLIALLAFTVIAWEQQSKIAILPPPRLEPVWVSFGLTAIRLGSSWGIRAPWL